MTEATRLLVKYKLFDPSFKPSVVVAYQSVRLNLALSAFCKSVWLESVPVILPQTALAMPSDEVATRSYPPAALPTSSLPYAGVVEVPVPPFAGARTPVTSLPRSTSELETTPPIDFKMPEALPNVNPFETTKLVV